MTSPVTSSAVPAVVQVATDGSGKRIANYAVQMYIDPQDGTGPALQTVYLQAVNVFQVDENGVRVGRDDSANDFEYKRQMLDEMRAIRLGIEYLLEMGRPTFDITKNTLLDEAMAQRLDIDTIRDQEI